jgi:hypothetical protein
VELDENGNIAVIKYNDTNQLFPIQYYRKNVQKRNNNVKQVVTLLINNGCRFVGDYAHAGGKNLAKLDEKQTKQFNYMHSKIDKLLVKCNHNATKNDCIELFKLLNDFNELSRVTRFFCKSFSNVYRDVPTQNVYFPRKNDSEYTDLRYRELFLKFPRR